MADTPTVEELAAALNYIDGEFVIGERGIDGEMWAEALAFGRPYNSREDHPVELPGHSYLAMARDMHSQLSQAAWNHIGARASYEAADQGFDAWGVRGGKR